MLAPADFQGDPLVGKLLDDADKQADPEFWMQATAALAEYRWGDGRASVKRLDTRVIPHPPFPDTQALADAVRALACQRAGQTSDARAALNRAKAVMARERPRPDHGWAFDWDWHNWIQVEILVREAETVIPTALVAAASPAQEENARRDRKDRADRLSTDFALALIRVEVGPKAQAEAELRAVLAARVKIAAEEPSNPDYRADLLASRLGLGRFLADAGRSGEAAKELTEAVAIGQDAPRRAADRPASPARPGGCEPGTRSRGLEHEPSGRRRPGASLCNRPAGHRLCRRPKTTGMTNELADAQYQLGEWYIRHGLLSEAAEVMRVDDWPPTVDHWRQIRAGQARLIKGDST